MNRNIVKSNIIFELQDYMFTSKNIDRFNKHMIQFDVKPFFDQSKNVCLKNDIKNNITTVDIKNDIKNDITTDIKNNITTDIKNDITTDIKNDIKIKNCKKTEKPNRYKPKQKDSLFWCFYILKNGYSNYEMEINNQYFVVEKNEKFKYISLIRQNKDILKIHKIKPLTELEDDLANKTNISIKTFFALCILENINILLVDKRKIHELLCVNIDNEHPINIIHKNGNQDFSIELDTTNEMIQNYRETYYKVNNFETELKSIGSYKLDELIELCNKLNINIEEYRNKNKDKKKLTKKDIYELLVMNY